MAFQLTQLCPPQELPSCLSGFFAAPAGPDQSWLVLEGAVDLRGASQVLSTRNWDLGTMQKLGGLSLERHSVRLVPVMSRPSWGRKEEKRKRGARLGSQTFLGLYPGSDSWV